MKAIVDGQVVAQSNDIVECKGYQYFPRAAVRMDWLEKADKTADDRACPHGVQFYDVVVDGRRHERAAWSYEAPAPGDETGRRPVRLLAGRRSEVSAFPYAACFLRLASSRASTSATWASIAGWLSPFCLAMS